MSGADERWGDAPVHSLATALFLREDEVHFFDVRYHTSAVQPVQHCCSVTTRHQPAPSSVSGHVHALVLLALTHGTCQPRIDIVQVAMSRLHR